MESQNPNDRSKVDEYVKDLKAQMPAAEHGALESRTVNLLNDASQDDFDVISTLSQEFDPQGSVKWEKYR